MAARAGEMGDSENAGVHEEEKNKDKQGQEDKVDCEGGALQDEGKAETDTVLDQGEEPADHHQRSDDTDQSQRRW